MCHCEYRWRRRLRKKPSKGDFWIWCDLEIYSTMYVLYFISNINIA